MNCQWLQRVYRVDWIGTRLDGWSADDAIAISSHCKVSKDGYIDRSDRFSCDEYDDENAKDQARSSQEKDQPCLFLISLLLSCFHPIL